MATKLLSTYPENSEMDMFAMEHGTAIWLQSPQYEHVLVSSDGEAKRFESLGWKVKGVINFDDFQGTIGY